MPDDQTITEGDAGFTGMASRLNPLQLQPGMVQYAENMRLDRGVAQTRKGAKRLASTIGEINSAITLPFQLGIDKSISAITCGGAGNLTATATLASHGYTTGDRINIQGASPISYNGDFFITVSGANAANAFTYTLPSDPGISASGALVANKGPVLQASYTGGILGGGIYSSPRLDNSNEYIVLAGPNACYIWREGVTLQDISYPASETIAVGDDIEFIQAFDKLYLLRSREESLLRLQTLTQVSGTATATTLGTHPYQTGEVVRISGAGETGYLADFQITYISPTQFSFAVPSATAASASGQIMAQRVQPALVWDGNLANDFVRVQQGTHPVGVTYSRLPSTSTATYFNNQLVVAKGRDEVLVSDVFDAETFDPVQKSFRANFGSNDFIVAIHPYAESQALVFCRKSIYIASIAIGPDGISIDPANSSLQLLTNEIGCCARRSIVTAGVYVFFLSDNGVYRLDNQFDLKLRGNTLPLSDPIADIFDEINAPAAHTSNAVYFNNRYYIAVPLGIDADPSAILAYNMLNNAWETLDTYGFGLDRLIVSDYGTQRRLFASARNGVLMLLDEQESGKDDTQSGLGSTSVSGLLLTRRYGFDSLNTKRLLRSKASVVLDAGAACTLDAVTTDYDADFQIAALSNTAVTTEDYTIKAPLRCKATAIDLRFRTSAGRPVLRTIVAEAARSGISPQETRTLN
jgi:hypothetical protein